MNKNETTFNVNGTLCTLVISEDNDGDCIKLWHELVSVETGKTIHTLSWSPYSIPSDDEVQQIIDLGLPDGLRWANSHPLSGMNFCSDILAMFLAGEEHPQGGKLELVFRVRHAVAA